MRRIVSVSIGSSKRDHKVEIELLGEKFTIERVGTNGDLTKASELIRELDGKVDAFGLGGTDIYIYAGKKRYIIKDAAEIVKNAKHTPIVDGSGLKNTLERKVINYLQEKKIIDFKDKNILMVSACDRFGMAQSLAEKGAKVTYGDLIFALGIPIPIKSLKVLYIIASIIAPIAVRLPFKLLYPTGKKQDKINPKYTRYYERADIIAGDFLFIKRYMPDNLNNKIIITNTVTKDDIDELQKRGVKKLITTTPELEGRSFGTNVMEALLVAIANKKNEALTPEDYEKLLDKLDLNPRIKDFDLGIIA